jgi:hypothetical protein
MTRWGVAMEAVLRWEGATFWMEFNVVEEYITAIRAVKPSSNYT